MDLHAAQMSKGKRGLSKLATLLCLGLASALLVGSLVNGKTGLRPQGVAKPAASTALPTT